MKLNLVFLTASVMVGTQCASLTNLNNNPSALKNINDEELSKVTERLSSSTDGLQKAFDSQTTNLN